MTRLSPREGGAVAPRIRLPVVPSGATIWAMGKAMSLALALLVGVGGCAAIRGPAWEPKRVEPDTAEVEESESDSDAPEYDEVDPFGTDPDVPDTEEPEGEGEAVADADKGAPEAGVSRKAAPAQKGCAGLDESTCKVTVGCAWDSIDDCVNE